MSYNRYCWSAYCILALILFVPPRPQRGGLAIDLAVAGGLLAMMFYLKITYFLGGLAAVGFATLAHPHVRRHWSAWLVLSVLLLANALAPYSHPYLDDIASWSARGAIRTGFFLHLNNFIAAIGLYAPYLAAIAIAGWMWMFARVPLRFPLTLAFLFIISLGLVTQNSLAVGLPTGIVMLLMLYELLRQHFAQARNRDIAPLLLTLLAFPFFEASSFAASIVGYHANATSKQGLYVVDRTNLKDFSLPEGRHGAFLSFSRTFDYPTRDADPAATARYQLTEYEYVLTLLDAADVLERQPPGAVVLFDSINPIPFMLGRKAPGGANLWSTWSAPIRPAAEFLGEIRYVLVPKWSLNPPWTDDLMRFYGSYVAEHFTRSAETRFWILLTRADANRR
jgi:hypothetical protein